MAETASPPADDNDAYSRRKERERVRQREQARIGQEVGPIPEVGDPALREEISASLRRFCEVVFASIFSDPWSDDHLEVLAITERIVGDGGRLALAMPRGQGKTSIFCAAVLWALLTGRRRFALLIGANKEKSQELIDTVKDALENNDVLADLFPEACHPIRCLEGQTNRAGRQTVDGSPSSGAILLVRSLTSSGMRGLNRVKFGDSRRPDLVLADDPQTDQSAASTKMTTTRMTLLNQALLGLAKGGVRLAILVACTVIRRGDLAWQLLDREKRPEWRGRVYKLLKTLPENMELWREYGRKRDDELRTSDDAIEATTWLRERWEEASRGAVVSWIHRCEPQQIDGLHFAMDMLTSHDANVVATFYAEYQNDPLDDQMAQGLRLDPLEIPKRTIELPRGHVPEWASSVVAFIDVQQRILYWVVAAFGARLRGHVVDYGAWPDQRQPAWNSRQPPVPLSTLYKGIERGATVRRGLGDLLEHLATREWTRSDGPPLPLARIGVDSGDGVLVDAILDGISASPHKGLVWPSRGQGIGPDSLPLREFKLDPAKGETRGERWIRQRMRSRRILQFVVDVNFWKSIVAAKLAEPLEHDGSISLFGVRGTWHGQFAEHCTNETFDRKASDKTKRTVDVWRKLTPSSENHWWDCLVGAAAIASSLGIKIDPPATLATPTAATTATDAARVAYVDGF
jgi:hypothetical protein